MNPVAANVAGVENHDAALAAWTRAGGRQRTLVHVDAHHDSWWTRERRQVSIANFIAPAIHEGLVDTVYWVTPDGAWSRAGASAELREQARRVVQSAGGEARGIVAGARALNARLGPARWTICPLDALPRFERPVLLDCDTDFMVIPEVASGRPDRHGALPWIWPRELVARLEARGVRSDLATVAYSVEGGYTPLRWRSLGDELRLRLLHPAAQEIAGYAELRQGDEAWAAGDADTAARCYRRAAGTLPASAAPMYRLAVLEWRAGRAADTRRHWLEALAREPVYASGFTTLAWPRLWQNRLDDAAAELDLALALDPEDAQAWSGRGELAWRRKEWTLARKHWEHALRLAPGQIDALRGLARTCERGGEWAAAAGWYRESLRQALQGRQPISVYIATATEPERLRDAGHGTAYAALARCEARRGETAAAAACCRMALAAGQEGVGLRLRLAAVLARQRRWRRAGTEVGWAVRAIPAGLSGAARRGWRRLRRAAAGPRRGRP